jgi:FecR protein
MGALARLAMCGLVGGAAAFGLFALAAPTASQSARLQVLSPQVTLSRHGTDQDVPAELVIRSGDTVRTDETGRAVVTYPDGSTATLDGSSELTIEFVRTSAGDYLVRMEQTIGRVWYAAARTIGSGGRYEVHSAAMASVIRAGSGFFVAVSQDGATSITATSGTVDATAGDVTVTLPAGTSTSIGAPGQTPAPPMVVAAPHTSPSVASTTEESPSAAIATGTADPNDEPQTSSGAAPTVVAPVAVAAPHAETARAHEAQKAPSPKSPNTAPVTVPYVPTSLLAPEAPEKGTTTEKIATSDKSTTAGSSATTSKEASTATRPTEATTSRTKECVASHDEAHGSSTEKGAQGKEREKGDGR